MYELIAKLCAVLLMKVDFNFAKMMLYGVRILDNACSYSYMPDKIYSKKGRTADNG